jgi:hypothetical protein
MDDNDELTKLSIIASLLETLKQKLVELETRLRGLENWQARISDATSKQLHPEDNFIMSPVTERRPYETKVNVFRCAGCDKFARGNSHIGQMCPYCGSEDNEFVATI